MSKNTLPLPPPKKKWPLVHTHVKLGRSWWWCVCVWYPANTREEHLNKRRKKKGQTRVVRTRKKKKKNPTRLVLPNCAWFERSKKHTIVSAQETTSFLGPTPLVQHALRKSDCPHIFLLSGKANKSYPTASPAQCQSNGFVLLHIVAKKRKNLTSISINGYSSSACPCA